jgi:long-subunit fatty acid transport protein
LFGTLILAGTAGAAWRDARAAGVEHPDVGTIAIGRAGAYAADPVDGFAMEYNPAGFASQKGLRLTFDSNFAWQGLTFASSAPSATPVASVSNSAGPFWEPGGAVSYGLGAIGPLSALTVAFGVTGPSAIGKENYPASGAQRYSLINADYFIAYYSTAVAAAFRDWLAAGLTFQLVKGSAKFSQAVWSGSGPALDINDQSSDAIAHVDVSSGFIPTVVAGVTVHPLPWMAIGLSYRPHFTFDATGTLTTDLPPSAMAIGAHQNGNAASFSLNLADVVRFGFQVLPHERTLVEADVVWEHWTPLDRIVIHPEGITVSSDNLGTSKPLPDIVFPKNFGDAVSIRLGGEYALLPGQLTVRGGYLFETSAIPIESTNVDFGNWVRHMLAVGASYSIPRSPVAVDVAYAHHFLPSRTVTNSTAQQIVTPCLFPGCVDPQPLTVGNGTYNASLDVISLSVRLALDLGWPRP